MIGSLIIGFVGVILLIIGYWIWKKEKISLLHEYHYNNVSEEDKKAFCTLSGVGITCIGIALLVTAVVMEIIDSVWSFVAFAVGFVIGLALLIYAENRYNSK